MVPLANAHQVFGEKVSLQIQLHCFYTEERHDGVSIQQISNDPKRRHEKNQKYLLDTRPSHKIKIARLQKQ